MKALKIFNSQIPSIEEICIQHKEKALLTISQEDAIMYQERMMLKLRKKKPIAEGIEFLIYNTNIWEVGIGGINFLEEFEYYNQTTNLFAGFHENQYMFAIDSEGKIFLFGNVNESEVLKPLYPNEDIFIDFLLLYHKVHYTVFYKRQQVSAEDLEKIAQFISSDSTGFVTKLLFEELPI